MFAIQLTLQTGKTRSTSRVACRTSYLISSQNWKQHFYLEIKDKKLQYIVCWSDSYPSQGQFFVLRFDDTDSLTGWSMLGDKLYHAMTKYFLILWFQNHGECKNRQNVRLIMEIIQSYFLWKYSILKMQFIQCRFI